MTKSLTRRILLSLDQLGNVLILNGSEDETISSHCWRHRNDAPKWQQRVQWIDRLFLKHTGEVDHCKNSFEENILDNSPAGGIR